MAPLDAWKLTRQVAFTLLLCQVSSLPLSLCEVSQVMTSLRECYRSMGGLATKHASIDHGNMVLLVVLKCRRIS